MAQHFKFTFNKEKGAFSELKKDSRYISCILNNSDFQVLLTGSRFFDSYLKLNVFIFQLVTVLCLVSLTMVHVYKQPHHPINLVNVIASQVSMAADVINAFLENGDLLFSLLVAALVSLFFKGRNLCKRKCCILCFFAELCDSLFCKIS